MTMLNDTRVLLEFASVLTGSLDLSSPENRLKLARALSYTDGAGAGQANLIWHDRRTITASGTDDLDLSGSLTDALGNAAVFARVKMLLVYAASANTNNVVIGAAAANAWVGPFGASTHTVAVQPGGLHLSATSSAAGWVVTAGTGDILRFTNSAGGTSVIFDVAVLGASS